MSFTLMRINRNRDDSQRCWLLGHPATDVRTATPTGNERRSVQRLQNLQNGTGWKEKTCNDQGNQHVEFEGSGTREFATVLDAWRYKNSLCGPEAAQPHPWEGDVVLRMPTGAYTFEEVLMPGAVLQLAPIIGGGKSLTMTYTVKAPHVEPLRTGRRSRLTVSTPIDWVNSMTFWGQGPDSPGAVAAGVTSDLRSVGVNAFPSAAVELPVGTRVLIQVYDSVAETALDVTFEVVAPGGAASGGRIAVEYPLTRHLDVMAAAFDSFPHVSAEVTTADDRPCLLLKWITPAAGSLNQVVIGLGLFDEDGVPFYGGSNSADTEPANYDAPVTLDGEPVWLDVAD